MKDLKTPRQEKIAEEIRREVSTIISFEIQDPRVYGVSVTGVKMTPDLRLARVYFTIPGNPDRASEVKEGLKRSASFIKRSVAQRLNHKFAPNFDFFYDESLELQDRIDTLFLEIEKKRIHE